MRNSDKPNQADDLFVKERRIIEHADEIIATLSDDSKIDLQEFKVVLKYFTRTLKNLAKIIRIHDKQQHEISILKDKMSDVSSQIARYIPHQVYQTIFSKKNKNILAPERKKMTVFFSDIINFSELTQDMEPEALASSMTTYLDLMFNIAKEYGGTIDKIIGDGILIFFGAPVSSGEKQDVLACIKMAIAMRNAVHNLRGLFLQKGITNSIKIRMAVHTGYCTVGNFGNRDRMDYTAIGSPVNLSNRLQNLAESNQILVTHEVYTLIKDEIYCEKKDEVFFKGFRYPIFCYEVHDLLENINNPTDISQSFDGFSLYFNKSSIPADKSSEVTATLKKIIKLMEENKKNKHRFK